MQSSTSINQTTTTITTTTTTIASLATAAKRSQCQETILHFNISGLETGRCRYVTLWHRWSEIDEDNPSLVALVLPCPLNFLQYTGTLSIGVQQLAPLPVEISGQQQQQWLPGTSAWTTAAAIAASATTAAYSMDNNF